MISFPYVIGVEGENQEAIAVFNELTDNKILQCCVVKTADDTTYVNMTNVEAGTDINAAVKAKLQQPPSKCRFSRWYEL